MVSSCCRFICRRICGGGREARAMSLRRSELVPLLAAWPSPAKNRSAFLPPLAEIVYAFDPCWTPRGLDAPGNRGPHAWAGGALHSRFSARVWSLQSIIHLGNGTVDAVGVALPRCHLYQHNASNFEGVSPTIALCYGPERGAAQETARRLPYCKPK